MMTTTATEYDPQRDGCCHMRAPETCPNCAMDAFNEAEIRDLITRAQDSVGKAVMFAGSARAAVEKLIGSQVYDIEFAEGTEGPDALAELQQAALSLRHASRIIAWRKRMLED